MAVVSKEKILDYLGEHKDEIFTARQIGDYLIAQNPEEFERKREALRQKNGNKDARQQVSAEVSARCCTLSEEYEENPQRNPHLDILMEKPRKYVLRASRSSSSDVVEDESEGELYKHDLYEMLAWYLHEDLRVYSKRINERLSSKEEKNHNKWMHPDLVGMGDLTSGLDDKIKEVAKLYPSRKALLWSFDVKLSLTQLNIRESYFQTVSNSSWANMGYLVAEDVNKPAQDEAEILNSLHGIGLIRINAEDPTGSEILIPARQRPEVHWETCDRLAKMNSDFEEYIRQISIFQKTGEVEVNGWEQPQNYFQE